MNVEAIIDKVIQSMTTKTVTGEPMEVGSLTLNPILNVSFGSGAGGGEAKAAVDDGGSGTGAGGGARMKVAGVLVIKGDDVQFVQTGAGGAIYGNLVLGHPLQPPVGFVDQLNHYQEGDGPSYCYAILILEFTPSYRTL